VICINLTTLFQQHTSTSPNVNSAAGDKRYSLYTRLLSLSRHCLEVTEKYHENFFIEVFFLSEIRSQEIPVLIPTLILRQLCELENFRKTVMRFVR
jgi:hypothetical protein